ncbi:MAG: hypothetical protein ACR2KJ_08810 [Jatrophihabitans sp.]
MASTEEPKQDRVGNDYHEGVNPAPGGEIDTSASTLPPYDDRSSGSEDRAMGTARAMGSEEALREPNEPQADEPPDADDPGRQAPENVGESVGRRGEDIAEKDGKEAGRVDTGEHADPSNRPTGESTARDRTTINPQESGAGPS